MKRNRLLPFGVLSTILVSFVLLIGCGRAATPAVTKETAAEDTDPKETVKETKTMTTGPAGPGSVQPGRIEAKATWACMGINWHFQGDDNRNAEVDVKYRRKGTDAWRPALNLWRHEYKEKRLSNRMFAGSVFRLAAGTSYEFKLELRDPDGGGVTETVTASTNIYPVMPAKTIDVHGGDLAAAQMKAEPGTVVLLHKGTYAPTTLDRSGEPDKWIVYKAAGDGEVIIDGTLTLSGSHIWLHGLTVKSPKTCIIGKNSAWVRITDCRMWGHYNIWTPSGSNCNYFIADNHLRGDSDGPHTKSGEGVDFGHGGTYGHAVCYNDISNHADGVSYGDSNIDVYNNYIHETVDDSIEPDYSFDNYRIWNNDCLNTLNGFSFQPMKGGPWYIIGNQMVGALCHIFKVRRIHGASVIVGNTMRGRGYNMRIGNLLKGAIINNVWIQNPRARVGYGGKLDPQWTPVTRIDHNAYGIEGKEPFQKIDYSAAQRKYGWDKHSIFVDYRSIFENPIREPELVDRKEGEPLFPKDRLFERQSLLPKPTSGLIDAGTVLPNIAGPYLGKAPDLGAHELGLGTPWYGPRTWDGESGLVYGIPRGWQKIPVARAADYKSLGCPDGKNAKVLLVNDSPRLFALMEVERASGEARWRRQREIVENAVGATTKILDFQDGFSVRLCRQDDNAILLASRVEPNGVLCVTVGCKAEGLDAVRVDMFRFVRSLFR